MFLSVWELWPAQPGARTWNIHKKDSPNNGVLHATPIIHENNTHLVELRNPNLQRTSCGRQSRSRHRYSQKGERRTKTQAGWAPT